MPHARLHARRVVRRKPTAQRAAARENAEVRSDLVERVRRQIAAGTYDTPERLGAAQDEMIDEVLAESILS